MSENAGHEFKRRRKAFVTHYLRCWNGTEAARRAGYRGEEPTLASQASHLLRNSKVRALIDRHLEKMQLSADEVLARLVSHATGDMSDLKKAEKLGKLHLISEISYTQYGPKIKLYDAQAALEKLGKAHALFKDKKEITGADGGPVLVKEMVVRFDE